MAVGAGEVNSIRFYWFKMFILWLCSLAIITHEVQRVKVGFGWLWYSFISKISSAVKLGAGQIFSVII